MPPGVRPSVAISSIGHVAVASLVFRVQGQLRVAAIAKASFAIVQDRDMVLAAPQPIVPADVHRNDNPLASLKASSDLVPYRPRADVLLTGRARAPGGRPTTVMGVRLMVARGDAMLVDKRIVVQGRTDLRTARPEPAPFDTMPLTYELAAGGPSSKDNPAGVAPRAMRGPNILDHWHQPKPVGLGPIASTWPARRVLLKRAQAAALEAPVPDLDASFPWAYFNAAPEDQRTDFLCGDEWVGFEGTDPEIRRVQSRLPGLRGVARIYGPTPALAAGQPIALVADTLLVESDRMRISVVWRGSVAVEGGADLAALLILAGLEAEGRPLAFPERYRPPSDRSPPPAPRPSRPDTGTIALTQEMRDRLRKATPFDAARPPAPADPHGDDARRTSEIPVYIQEAIRAAVTPFAPSAPAPPRDPLPATLPAATPFDKGPLFRPVPPSADPDEATVDEPVVPARGPGDVAAPPFLAPVSIAQPAAIAEPPAIAPPAALALDPAPPASLGAAFLAAMARAGRGGDGAAGAIAR